MIAYMPENGDDCYLCKWCIEINDKKGWLKCKKEGKISTVLHGNGICKDYMEKGAKLKKS